jgi:hypothetical protein
MTGPESKTQAGGVAAEEVLTFDEENVLSSIREVVTGIRALGPPVEVKDVEEAVVLLGGSASSETDNAGFRIFNLRGARFSLRPALGSPGAIEISFSCANL